MKTSLAVLAAIAAVSVAVDLPPVGPTFLPPPHRHRAPERAARPGRGTDGLARLVAPSCRARARADQRRRSVPTASASACGCASSGACGTGARCATTSLCSASSTPTRCRKPSSSPGGATSMTGHSASKKKWPACAACARGPGVRIPAVSATPTGPAFPDLSLTPPQLLLGAVQVGGERVARPWSGPAPSAGQDR